MAKTLVTHINPHLDDIAAIWLFKKFHPDFTDAKIEFISQSKNDEIAGTETEDRIFLGIGRGRFDEHKGDLDDCATSLVWKYLKTQEFMSRDEVEIAAIEELVEWGRLIDLARMPTQQYDDFTVQAFIRSTDNTQEGSLKTVKLGEEILDRILKGLINKHHSIKDWESSVEFRTRFGLGVAVKSAYVKRAFCYTQKGDVFLIYNPEHHDVQFCTLKRDVDLEPIYSELKKKDPQADWYLHQSHHMVINGSGSAPDAKPTELSFEQLIEIAKSV